MGLNEDEKCTYLHHFSVVYLCLFQLGLQFHEFFLHLTNLQKKTFKMVYIKKWKMAEVNVLVKLLVSIPETQQMLAYPDRWYTSFLLS